MEKGESIGILVDVSKEFEMSAVMDMEFSNFFLRTEIMGEWVSFGIEYV